MSEKVKRDSMRKDFKEGKSPRLVLWWLFIFGLFLIFAPPMFTKLSWWSLDYNNPGEIGDIIAGTTVPFISLAGVFVTFLAFWIQYKANLELRKDIEVERFENKYYELLRLHRANVEEMNIKDRYRGRKVFVAMYNELRYSFYFVKGFVQAISKGKSEIELGFRPDDDVAILKIAYLLFFHGTGDKSDRLLVEPLSKICTDYFLKNLLVRVNSQQSIFRTKKSKSEWVRLTTDTVEGLSYQLSTDYVPLDGHISRLGHYYRHLYQAVKYVAEFSKIKFNHEEKYGYLKTLRAQLSSHEQILLYYNSLSYFGGKWLDQKHPYLVEYKMIKNLPLPLADFGIKPEVKFKKEIEELRAKGQELFEWHEQEKQT